MGYSRERKEAVLKKLLPPINMTVAALAVDEGISEATIYNWRRQARNEGQLIPAFDNATTKSWTSRDKFAAVLESAAMNQAELAEYCRKKGLYPEELMRWRQACEEANDWSLASDKKVKEATQSERKKSKQLEKELARKEKALAEAAALLVLRKKYNALFADPEDES